MFSIPFLVWAFLSSFLIGFLIWTSWILYLQKKAWRKYAAKKNMRYAGNKIYDSPEVSGAIGEYKVKLFASDHMARDARGSRKLTSIEVSLLSHLPVGAAVASGGMVQIVDELVSLNQEFRPDLSGWDDSYIVRTRDNKIVRAYLNDERLKALVELMKIKNAWVILIFSEDEGLLRIDTPDPLEKPGKLDALLDQLVEAARVFEIPSGEYKRLMHLKGREEQGNVVLDIDDSALEDKIGFELEDE